MSAAELALKCSSLTGNSLFSFWANNNCPNAYAAIINSSPGYTYNQQNTSLVILLVNELFGNYLSTNKITNDVTDPKYNPFQNVLENLCTDPSLPGVCSDFQSVFCSVPRSQVSTSPVLTNFCGCIIPPDPTYMKYTNNASCDPLCRRAETSQKADITTGNLITCPEDVCVIDDITINISNSQVKGGINITSFCPSCNGSCSCIVSGINVSKTLSDVGVGSTNIDQFCSGSSVCITQDTNGNITNTQSCSQAASKIPIPGSTVSLTIGIVVILIIFLVIFIIIWTIRNK